MAQKEILKRKNCDNYFSWMDNEKLRESIRDFAQKQKNHKYHYYLIERINKKVIFDI